jgi:hypothetical protein
MKESGIMTNKMEKDKKNGNKYYFIKTIFKQ